MSDKLKSIAKAIGSFAPTLATMLGGPLAGTAVTALEGALGLAPGAGADGITNVVQGGLSTEALAAVRAADQKHAEIIGQQKIDLAKLNADHDEAFAKIDADDRDSARRREMAIKDHTPTILAYFVVLLVVTIEGGMLIHGQPRNVDGVVLGRILGTLDAALVLVLGYYFGSSAGAQKANQALTDIAKQP